jgi:Prealbumin-like fold domain/Coenzyme PQQ synthesis protein D (PqqD)
MALELEIARSGSSELVVQALPDGSTAIFEVATRNVYSLNPSAAAAWESCASPTTLSQLAAAMSRRLNAPVTEDLAHEAVSELVAVGLVRVTPAERLGTSRRAMLKQAAGVALPVVLALTGAEQRAHAQVVGSPPVAPPGTTTGPSPTTPGPTPTTPGPTPTTTQGVTPTTTSATGGSSLVVIKSVGTPPDGPFVALPGAVFEIRSAGSNVVVATITTDAQGRARASLPPGMYTLIETSAPGAVVDATPSNFEIRARETTLRNRFNVPVGPTPTTTPGPTPTTTPGTNGGNFVIIKSIGTPPEGPFVALPGAVFEIRRAGSNVVVATITTNAQGRASVTLPPGMYTLTEITAPGAVLDATPSNFEIVPGEVTVRNRFNIRLTT